jgi:DNA-binding CsgD family transcriptional regulator
LSQFGDSVEKTSPLAGPVLLEQRGRLRLLQGRRSEALADLFAAGSRAEECEVDNPAVTSWRSEVAHILSEDGRDEDAFRIAEENLELARAYGAEWVVGSALHLLACVGEADERLDRLEEAVQLLDALPARLRLAEAMIDLGRALREIDPSSPRVRELLRGAADLAFRGRATPLVSSATTELRLSGARPRRLALSGADALTSSERRVIARAADGMSNAEIASELFLAEKTVEGHLGRSFRKLGIRSRRELEAMRDLRGSEPNAVG